MKYLNTVLLLLLAALLVAPAARAQDNCPGPIAGEPGCAGTGNPINVITGNKFQREVDLAPLPGVMGLEIVRYYNSSLSGLNSRTGILGRGWRLSYETTLAAIGDTVQVLQADGTRLIFSRDLLRPSLCSSADPANGEIDVRRTPRGDEYVWRKIDGQRLSFNPQGRLVQVLAPSGEFVSMQHDARGWLVKVTDPQGRSLTLDYLDRKAAATGTRFSGVQAIVSPVGRFTFGYGSDLPAGADAADRRQLLANLVQVTTPDGAGRRYHYEDARFPTLMTGISVPSANGGGKRSWQRYATFGYDGNALAVSSTHANGVVGIELDHSVGGRTVLTNSLGQKTVYRYGMVAGAMRIQEVVGPGCALCGRTNVRYGYDRQGRMNEVTRLGADGRALETTHTEVDYYGRPTRISRIHYKDGKAGKPQWQQRFEYAPGTALKPILIARPSVVPGREHTTRIRYGATPATRAVPVQIAETGYVPTADGAGASRQISRVMEYRYDGRGRRVEVDGPLANAAQDAGPGNSDITRIEHDQKTGLPIRTIAPGRMVVEVLERDAALRPMKVRSSDGYRAQTATIRSNWRGQPETIRIDAVLLRMDGSVDSESLLTRSFSYRYDLQGRIERLTAPGELTTRFAYDAAGRLTHSILPDGSRLATKMDSEGKKTAEARYLGEADKALSIMRFQYDANGRLAQVEDDIGLLEHATYTDLGQVAELTNGLGVATRFSYDDNGMLRVRMRAADTPDQSTIQVNYDSHGRPEAIEDAKHVRTVQRHDDFARKVFESGPDRGVMLYVHDEAGRMVARIDESLGTTRYRYDHAGRLVALGADSDTDLVHYDYEGMHMIRMTSAQNGSPRRVVESLSNQYDAFGQLLRDERWIARVQSPPLSVIEAPARHTSPAGLTFTTYRQYDVAGRLVQQLLPDGHRVRYVYHAGETAAGSSKPGQLSTILFDDEIVVSGIEQSVVGGMTGYINGNGVRQQVGFDSRRRVVSLNAATSVGTSESNILVRFWRRVAAWVGPEKLPSEKTIYRQTNGYDQRNRLVSIYRQHEDPNDPEHHLARTETYRYDRIDRLVEMAINGKTSNRFSYDANGNRLAELNSSGSRHYYYQKGNNRLLATTDRRQEKGNTAAQATQAWLYHSTGAPLIQMGLSQDSRGLLFAKTGQRIIYNQAKRPIVVFGEDDRPIARYYYNGSGERIAKSVNQGSGVTTTYSLYDAQRLSAETDEDGKIRTHYIYLYGKPVAKIEMQAPGNSGPHLLSQLRNLLNRIVGGARLDVESQGKIYAVHTDHLGMPQAVSDPGAKVVWRATSDPFGKLDVTYAEKTVGGESFDMRLRLPGQIFDAETRLHQNYYRDYNPDHGRYVTADPIGLAGGVNPYEYANSNPLTKVDPLGLYQSDIHYYMTYFLAITAGMGAEDARTMALATQYIDDNPDTRPLNPANWLTVIFSPIWNREHLAKYHFTLWTQEPGVWAVFSQDPNTSEPMLKSPQLKDLYKYAANYGAPDCSPNNISLQFMGEFLHAFEDTYAHRSPDNIPFPVNFGIGHGTYESSPDYTYNHTSTKFLWEIFGQHEWVNNESRTLAMELATYEQIVKYMDARNYQEHSEKSGKRTSLKDEILLKALVDFNQCRVNEDMDEALGTPCNPGEQEGGDAVGMYAKIKILNDALHLMGYTESLNWSPDKNAEKDGYNVKVAEQNRAKYFQGLNPKDYPAAIIPKGKNDKT